LNRILVLTPEYPPRVIGDVAVHAHAVAKGMADEGVLTSVITFDDWRPGEAVEEGVRVCRVTAPIRTFYSILTWSPLTTPEFVRAASKVIRGEGVDLVLSLEWLTGLSAMTLKAIYHLPLISVFHSTEAQRTQSRESPLSKGIAYLERGIAEAADLLIATDEAVARMLVVGYAIPRGKVEVIGLGDKGDVGRLLRIQPKTAVMRHEGPDA
jgi:hypothetical protein